MRLDLDPDAARVLGEALLTAADISQHRAGSAPNPDPAHDAAPTVTVAQQPASRALPLLEAAAEVPLVAHVIDRLLADRFRGPASSVPRSIAAELAKIAAALPGHPSWCQECDPDAGPLVDVDPEARDRTIAWVSHSSDDTFDSLLISRTDRLEVDPVDGTVSYVEGDTGLYIEQPVGSNIIWVEVDEAQAVSQDLTAALQAITGRS